MARASGDMSKQLKLIALKLETYLTGIEKDAKEELDSLADEIKADSLAICPVDTSELIKSVYIDNEEKKDRYTVEIGYKSKHAVFAHENSNRGADYKRPTKQNTHWQFLLTPATEIESEIVKRVADKIKRNIR